MLGKFTLLLLAEILSSFKKPSNKFSMETNPVGFSVSSFVAQGDSERLNDDGK